MRIRMIALGTVLAVALIVGITAASADVLKLKDGTNIEGVIKKVEAGLVYMRVGNEDKTFEVLKIENIDFNTPHLLHETANAPIEHFLKDVDSQEMVRNFQDLEKAAADMQKMLSQIKTYWVVRQPIDSKDAPAWEAAKRDYTEALRRYQELLNDMYFHLLAKVDAYNLMMRDASKVYVGVKGIKIGSHLVAKEFERLPLRKYVPAAWYDTIFFEGYNLGYDDGYNKVTPPKTPSYE